MQRAGSSSWVSHRAGGDPFLFVAKLRCPLNRIQHLRVSRAGAETHRGSVGAGARPDHSSSGARWPAYLPPAIANLLTLILLWLGVVHLERIGLFALPSPHPLSFTCETTLLDRRLQDWRKE